MDGLAGHSRLTSIMQGKQKGNKGDIVRQKDQGYVDAVAPMSGQQATSSMTCADMPTISKAGTEPSHTRERPRRDMGLYELKAIQRLGQVP